MRLNPAEPRAELTSALTMRPSCSVTPPSKLLISTGLPVTMLLTIPSFTSSNIFVWAILVVKRLRGGKFVGITLYSQSQSPRFQAGSAPYTQRLCWPEGHTKGVQCDINHYLYKFTPRFWITAYPWLLNPALCWDIGAFFLALHSHLFSHFNT